ncbi:MAG: hypothetical protein M3P50_10445 [Actinomycetota bacterium]|nr:hypothetical protein [Actinomycetota bacterium]
MLLVTAGLVLASAAPAEAGRRVEDSYCSPSGDYCESVFRKRGVRFLAFATFSLRGSLRVCVTPPQGEATCRKRRMRETADGVYELQMRWSTSFARAGKGRYRVRFSQGGFKAPSLTFRVR